MRPSKQRVRYGYKSEGGQLVEIPEQMAVIRRIMKQHHDFCKVSWIVADLKKRGTPTQRGGQWRSNTVNDVIKANYDRFPPPALPQPDPQVTSNKFWEDEIEAARAVDPEATHFRLWNERLGSDPRKDKSELVSIEWMEKARVEVAAAKQLTVAEKAQGYKFEAPHRVGFGDAVSGPAAISEIVKELTKRTGYDVNVLIDGITNQRRTKQHIRNQLNRLCWEIQILRQANLSLRQEADELRRRDFERSRRATVSPGPSVPPAERPRPILRRTIDPETVKDGRFSTPRLSKTEQTKP